jgi:O-antigen/teichoic acid export membrane protein
VALAAGHLASTVYVYLLAFVLFRRLSRLRLSAGGFDAGLLRHLLTTGSGYFAYSLSYLLLQSDIVLVGFVLGPGAAAIYGVASRAVDQIVQLVWKVPDSLLPLTAEFSARGELGRFMSAHRISSKMTIAAAFFAAAAVWYYGRPILVLWVGAEHAASQPVLAALAAVVLTHAFVHASVVVPYGANRMGRLPAVALVEALLKIGLALALLPRVAIVGAALSTVLAQLLCTVWYAPLSACRLTGDSMAAYVRSVIVPVLPACAGLIVCFWAAGRALGHAPVQVLIGVLAGLAAYLVLYALYGLRPEERGWLRSAASGASATSAAGTAVVWQTRGM